MSVDVVLEAVGESSELHVGHILQAEDLAVACGAENDVVELIGVLQAPLVFKHILEALVALFAKLAGSCLDVLLGESGGDVGRHQFILRHHLRLQPDTHRIVGTERHGVADARDALDLRDHVDRHVVVDKLSCILVFGVKHTEHHKHRSLALLGDDTHLVYLRGEESRSLGHTVLHVDGRHVRVHALLEVDLDFGRAVVGGRREHVVHVFRAVDLLLERSDHRVHHGLGIGTGVGCAHTDGRRRDVGILFDRKTEKTEDTEDHDEDRDYGRQHRPIDEIIKFHILSIQNLNQ